MNDLQTMKAWIVYGGSPEWWSASLILENGFVCASHLCSHPCFMSDDLIQNRKERIEAFRRMGYKIDLQGEPIAGSDNAPSFLLENNKNEESYKEFAETYNRHIKELEESRN